MSRLIVTMWMRPKNMWNKKSHRSSVTRTHAQCHVTLTYLIKLDSNSVDSNVCDIFDPKTCETKKNQLSSVTRTRARISHVQGYVTLIYKVTLKCYSVDSYLFDIRDPKDLRNEKQFTLASLEPELGKVTLMVTWPWHTRSSLIVTEWIYIHLTYATPKTCEMKMRSSL